MLIVVVDDILKTVYAEFNAAFVDFCEVKECDSNSYVGLQLTRVREERLMYVTQWAAIEKLLKENRFGDCNPEDAPAIKNLCLSVVADCPETGSQEQTEMKKYPYRSILGSLLYISVITRPDIAFIVNSLARFAHNPGKINWNAMYHVLRYLRGATNHSLVLGLKDKELEDESKSPLKVYADASWADNVDDRHSTSGCCITLFGSCIFYCSRNQYLLVRSSFEAELISLYMSTAQFAWIRSLILDSQVPRKLPHESNSNGSRELNSDDEEFTANNFPTTPVFCDKETTI